MKSKKHRDAQKTHEGTPETDTDDIYLPVCCGEFGVRQAAGFRDLWEATWSQDRRGRDETSEEKTPVDSNDCARDTEEESPEG
jgi:hypothetical protein